MMNTNNRISSTLDLTESTSSDHESKQSHANKNERYAEADALLHMAEELGKIFSESKLYQDYCKYKIELEKNPLLMERVAAFKSAQMELETRRQQSSEALSFDDEKRILYQYTDLCLNPTARAFLMAEQELLDLYRRVMDLICEGWEL